MTTIRSSGVLAVPIVLLVLLVAACGGSSASSAPASADSGSGTGAAASADSGGGTGAAASADTGSGTGSGGGAAGDAANLGQQLVPPNSTESVKTTTDTYWYVTYTSTDSPDSLKGFYESQIPKTGMKIVSTTSASGSYVWTISRDDAGSFGGAVTVGPGPDGTGSTVIVAVGS